MGSATADLSAPAIGAFFSRAPLFDRDLRLAGYVVHSGAAVGAGGGDALASGWPAPLTPEALDDLTGGVTAWITVTPEAFLGKAFPHGLRDQTVIEVPAYVLADHESVSAGRAWRAEGYRLAVHANPEDRARDALYDLASAVRFTTPPGDPAAVSAQLARLGAERCVLAATGVNTMAAQRALRDAGVQYFQGAFFTAPDAVSEARLPVSFGTVARLMGMIEQPELSDRAIELELRADPALSYKLLRMVNSAATGMRAVGSILHAIQIIGRNGLQRWLALLAVEGSVAGTPIERERRQLALETARLCEQIAEGTVLRRHSNSLFLTGMLAAMSPMTSATPSDLLADVRVNSDVSDAMAGRGGLYAPVLQLATAYAAADWRVVQTLGQELRVLDQLPAKYRSAIRWARESLARA